MATNGMTGTVVGQRYYNGGWNSYNTSYAAYAGRTSSAYYPYILKFTTPAFVGVSEYVQIFFKYHRGYGTEVTLWYSLCTSDSNYQKYQGTSDVPDDSNRISGGTITLSNIPSDNTVKGGTVSINSTLLKPSTTYYLFLWACGDTRYITVLNTSNHGVVLGYNAGLIHIDNGTSFDAYQVYVDNGTSWDLCIPYIDNGTDWEMSG